MNPNPLESVIEHRVCDYAKTLRVLSYKFTSPARRSVPDRLMVMPEGRGCFFMEMKRKGQQPTAAQAVEIARIRAQGVKVYVIDSVEQGKRVIDHEMQGVGSIQVRHNLDCHLGQNYKDCPACQELLSE